ncbi:PilN domain-containing protein [Alkalilimnicola ehrlichii MLHE-1]|uniref:Fimbrial assembly family protein n=1 Tax=Alkalilimnicola ehrlichii (strain ATCC BAA-1101 / DSM 17681 / MLHE-1) TaxID=187272 RepID=Q0A4Z1_ALKEH|nr:PilN domain-containing protein [Alkalilimnicola ehrlichii]ABI58096.1 Fimbrial assembly family protein [Alkalilimnicola ehrlichii MLHE-1]
MTRINLLPWREAERERRKKAFFAQLGAAVLAAGLVWYGATWYMDSLIDRQQARNDRIQQALRDLDSQIAEIEDLERELERLISRAEVIQDLQDGRTAVVQLLEEMVNILHDGIYFTSIRQRNSQISIQGRSRSPQEVSVFLQNIDNSTLLGDPDLDSFEAGGADGEGQPRYYNFAARTTQQSNR